MSSLQDQLTKYLTDLHSIEQQALAQMRVAPLLAGEPELADTFERHCRETVEHERKIREHLGARGASPSIVKDLLGTLTGKGFVAFARAQPDTPGKLVVHAFSYEHMERAAYEMLALVAERAGDAPVLATAREIADEENAMAARLSASFDGAAEASLREVEQTELGEQLDKYLADAHAIEAQSLQLLDRAPNLAGSDELARAYAAHRRETEDHLKQIGERLRARGSSPSRLKDAVLRLGGLNWSAFFGAQPDTPAKLAAFSYAFEHLEIGAYEMLRRVAERAGDEETQQLAASILGQERSAAQRLHALFETALEASLPALDGPAPGEAEESSAGPERSQGQMSTPQPTGKDRVNG
jgi:ferritin-like metal-binding protein YciE